MWEKGLPTGGEGDSGSALSEGLAVRPLVRVTRGPSELPGSFAAWKDLMRANDPPRNDVFQWDHASYMGLALDEARRGYEEGEVPVGAVLASPDGRLLARAHNRPIGASDPTAHAEILALREAARRAGNYRLPGTVLYVTLEPCPMCLGAILHSRVSVLVFGAADLKSGAAGGVVDLTNVPVFNHYVRTVPGVRAMECAGLLRRFFRERRRAGNGVNGGEVPKWP